MNVFVKERAHQSVAAWCLHQCVQETPHQSITQDAPTSFQKEKDFTLKCYTESLAFKEITQGMLLVPRGEKNWERNRMPQKAIIWNFKDADCIMNHCHFILIKRH